MTAKIGIKFIPPKFRLYLDHIYTNLHHSDTALSTHLYDNEFTQQRKTLLSL
jgi:hypothetical protein